jgi:hypothetical protein
MFDGFVVCIALQAPHCGGLGDSVEMLVERDMARVELEKE